MQDSGEALRVEQGRWWVEWANSEQTSPKLPRRVDVENANTCTDAMYLREKGRNPVPDWEASATSLDDVWFLLRVADGEALFTWAHISNYYTPVDPQHADAQPASMSTFLSVTSLRSPTYFEPERLSTHRSRLRGSGKPVRICSAISLLMMVAVAEYISTIIRLTAFRCRPSMGNPGLHVSRHAARTHCFSPEHNGRNPSMMLYLTHVIAMKRSGCSEIVSFSHPWPSLTRGGFTASDVFHDAPAVLVGHPDFACYVE